ncbi:MAG TPA: hypothetical protein VLW85_07795 [Myxococcales bacterium]|nr:hypothetical protein [Myxococcales bacterium]
MRLAIIVLLSAAAARADGFRQITTAAPAGEKEDVLIEGEVEHGGYGGPRVAYGRVAGHDAIDVGAEGGWIVNHHFILGGAGYGLVTSQPAPGVLATTDDLRMGYGGGMIGYTIFPQRLVHATFTVLIGAGALASQPHLGTATNDLADSFFVCEPAATMDVNVARHFRFGLAVSYRFVRGVDTSGLSNGDLSGVFGSAILKFGKF